MRFDGFRTWILGASVGLLLGGTVEAQVLRCNMTDPCGSSPAPGCAAGCSSSTGVFHQGALPCGGGGSFDLRGTHFEGTCSLGNGCTVLQPVLRFWQYDHYAKGNNGCQRQDDTVQGIEWLVNAFLDDGTSPEAGHWYMWQPNWAGPQIDGCFATISPPPTPRTVAEISSVDARTGFEGTINHGSWYVLGSVDLSGQFNFDRITGGTGCSGAEIQKQTVAGVTVVRRGGLPCTGSAVETEFGRLDENPLPGYFDVALTIGDPNPHWWTEAGQDGAPQLIEGYQILYTTGAEPTSSDLTTGGWLPVYDPADLVAPKNALGVVPLGTTSVTVSIPVPSSPGPDYWLATRIVYRDATENPPGPFDPAAGTPTNPVGPQIASTVSGHCGPVVYRNIAVEFGSVEAYRTPVGVTVRFSTLSEDDTNGFRVTRSADEAGTESVVDVAAWVEAHGPNRSYEVADASALSGMAYYYYVQELTSNGLGDRSPAIRVEAADADGPSVSRGGSSGGRARGRRP